MVFVKGLQTKHLRSVFSLQLRAGSPGQGQPRGRRTRCHSCSHGSAMPGLTRVPAEPECSALKEHGFAHSLVADAELSSCLVSSVITCSQYPSSVSPEVFCLLCSASSSAPSTQAQGFSEGEFLALPQARDHGLGCRQQRPSWDESRHSPLGKQMGKYSCHLPPPWSSGADPALPGAPTQQGSSMTHHWGYSPSSVLSGL